MSRKGDKYRVIFCTINKKYKEAFEEALEELKTKMLLLGHTDYEEYCEQLEKEFGIINAESKGE